VIDTLAAGDTGKRDALAEAAGFDLQAQRFQKDAVFIAGTASELVELWAPILPKIPKYAVGSQSRALFTKFGAEHVTAYDDVADTLAALGEARLAMGIATNDEEISARTQMRALRLDGRFSFVAGADTGHGAKPGPGMLLAFAEHIGAEPREVLMIGDSTHDLHAARAAGMIGVAVGTGPASLDDLKAHAAHTIPRIGNLPALVAALQAA
jgi:phosphoglycolate phosphatase